MATNYPWSKNDVVVTDDGTSVGRVKKTVTKDSGEDLLIIGDINPDLISFFPNQPSETDQIGFTFTYEVEGVTDYSNGVVRLPEHAPKSFQNVYDDQVKKQMEEILDNIEKALDKGLKLGENEDPEIVHNTQEHLRGIRRNIRKGMNEDRFNGKGDEYLRQMDRIEEEFQDIMFDILRNEASQTESEGAQDQSESPSPTTKDSEVESELDDFYDYLENELVPKAKKADPEERLQYIRKGLQGVKELRAMVRGFDQAGTLENPHEFYDEIDDIEELLREDERRAMKMVNEQSRDTQSIFESISKGLQAYSEAKKATNNNRDNNRERTRREPEPRQQEQKNQNTDPYTGGRSQSSSISESASRFWNTVTLQNAFSPKCPRCNRKSSAPVSGEEDVYQCDNCGNIFDTHPDSRREIDFDEGNS